MGFLRGLSGRLLVVTVVIVMLVEVVIFIPSVSRFRIAYLEERLARAEIAAMAMLAAPDGITDPALETALLDRAEVLNIVAQRGGARLLMMRRGPLPMIEATFDLRAMGPAEMILDALARLASPPGPAVVRVIGQAPMGTDPLEITLDAAPLRAAMIDYGLRILRLSLVISLLTAAVVFLAIRSLVVAPVQRVIDNLRTFRENPEDAGRVIVPSARIGEVAEAERVLAEMERDVQTALRERARLAGLGQALAKVSHDLRNMLSAQQLLIDRLERSEDPLVARVMPKIMSSLDRAIRLCQRTLDFGKAEEPEPVLREVALRPVVEEVAETVGLAAGDGPVALRIEVPEGHIVPADHEHLYRVLANLLRNAAEAIADTGRPGVITVAATREGGEERITVSDTGPGLPAAAREHIFKPFRGGARRGGTGLGLAIAHDLVAAHGGRLELLRSTTEGTVFEIVLPAARPTGGRRREAARAG